MNKLWTIDTHSSDAAGVALEGRRAPVRGILPVNFECRNKVSIYRCNCCEVKFHSNTGCDSVSILTAKVELEQLFASNCVQQPIARAPMAKLQQYRICIGNVLVSKVELKCGWREKCKREGRKERERRDEIQIIHYLAAQRRNLPFRLVYPFIN